MKLTAEEQFWTVAAISQLPEGVKAQLRKLIQDKYDEGFSDGIRHMAAGKDVTIKWTVK